MGWRTWLWSASLSSFSLPFSHLNPSYLAGNYLADGYFNSEAQNAQRSVPLYSPFLLAFLTPSLMTRRWLYYRKRTEGQNTLLMGGLDQNVLGVPTTGYGSSGDNQTALVYDIDGTSIAYFTADLTDM